MCTNKMLFLILKYFINVDHKLLNCYHNIFIIIGLKQDMKIALAKAACEPQ